MKKEVKIGGLVLGLIALIGISFVLYKNGLMNYLIITGTFTVICTIILVNTLITTRSDEAEYKSKLRQILRTYDSILVKSKNLPKLDNLNIIRVDTIEDLVDAQMEIRKPIYYQEQTESCAFVLLDNMTACFYTLKVNDAVLCPLEITINELDIINKNSQKELEEDIPEDLLSEIERTAIIRLKKGKYVKVSPMRNRKKAVAKEEIKEKIFEKTQDLKSVLDEKLDEAKEVVEDTKEKVEKVIEDTKDKVETKSEEIKEKVNDVVEVASDKVEEAKEKAEDIQIKAEAVKEIVEEKVEEAKEVIEDKKEEAKEKIADAKEKLDEKVEETKAVIEEKTEDIKEMVSDTKEKVEEIKEQVSDKVDEVKKEVNHQKKKNKAKKKAKEFANNAVDASYKVKHEIEDLLFEDDRNAVEKTVDKVSEEVDKAKTKVELDTKIDDIVDNVADFGKKKKKKHEIEDLDDFVEKVKPEPKKKKHEIEDL